MSTSRQRELPLNDHGCPPIASIFCRAKAGDVLEVSWKVASLPVEDKDDMLAAMDAVVSTQAEQLAHSFTPNTGQHHYGSSTYARTNQQRSNYAASYSNGGRGNTHLRSYLSGGGWHVHRYSYSGINDFFSIPVCDTVNSAGVPTSSRGISCRHPEKGGANYASPKTPAPITSVPETPAEMKDDADLKEDAAITAGKRAGIENLKTCRCAAAGIENLKTCRCAGVIHSTFGGGNCGDNPGHFNDKIFATYNQIHARRLIKHLR